MKNSPNCNVTSHQNKPQLDSGGRSETLHSRTSPEPLGLPSRAAPSGCRPRERGSPTAHRGPHCPPPTPAECLSKPAPTRRHSPSGPAPRGSTQLFILGAEAGDNPFRYWTEKKGIESVDPGFHSLEAGSRTRTSVVVRKQTALGSGRHVVSLSP